MVFIAEKKCSNLTPTRVNQQKDVPFCTLHAMATLQGFHLRISPGAGGLHFLIMVQISGFCLYLGVKFG